MRLFPEYDKTARIAKKTHGQIDAHDIFGQNLLHKW